MEALLQYVWKHKLWPLKPLTTTDGEAVEVIDSGLQNRNAGPDFFNAKVKIGGMLWVGNVEIHDRAADWNAHGHSADPAYADVALHVAWFPPVPGEVLPEIPLALLRDAMLDRPGFSFDQIDPSAYPRPPRSSLHPHRI